jgi:hypothetical protein
MARGRQTKSVEVVSKSGIGVRTRTLAVSQATTERAPLLRSPPKAYTFGPEGGDGRVTPPPHGWKVGLEDLIARGRCPYCRHRVQNLSVGAWGLTWACFDGCNP